MPSLLNLDAVVIFTLSQSYSEAPPDFTEIEKSAEDEIIVNCGPQIFGASLQHC